MFYFLFRLLPNILLPTNKILGSAFKCKSSTAVNLSLQPNYRPISLLYRGNRTFSETFIKVLIFPNLADVNL